MSSCGRGVFLECPNGHTSMFTSSTIISPLWSLPSYVHIRGIRSLVALIQALFSVAFAGTNVPAQIWVLESLSRKDPGMLHQQTPSRYCILAYWKPWWWLWSPIPIFFVRSDSWFRLVGVSFGQIEQQNQDDNLSAPGFSRVTCIFALGIFVSHQWFIFCTSRSRRETTCSPAKLSLGFLDGHQPNSRGYKPMIRIPYWIWDDHSPF